MRALSRKSPDHSEALDRVRNWTRAHFKLSEDMAIMVSEVTCAVPGCAPLETIVAFWTADDQRHHFKVFKPVAEVVLEDFPPPWMKNALIEIKGFGCDCC
jgi:hypothetical protein